MHIWSPEGIKYHFSTKKVKKSFTPGTLFEQGPPDPKSDALPTELDGKENFAQKSLSFVIQNV